MHIIHNWIKHTANITYLPGVPILDPGVPTLELGVPYCSGGLIMSISLVGRVWGGEENSRSVCGDEARSLLSLGGCGDVTSDVRMVAPCVSPLTLGGEAPLTLGGEENKSFPKTALWKKYKWLFNYNTQVFVYESFSWPSHYNTINKNRSYTYKSCSYNDLNGQIYSLNTLTNTKQHIWAFIVLRASYYYYCYHICQFGTVERTLLYP